MYDFRPPRYLKPMNRFKVPVGVGFAKRAGLVRDGAPDEFAALAGQLTVFRFDPDD